MVGRVARVLHWFCLTIAIFCFLVFALHSYNILTHPGDPPLPEGFTAIDPDTGEPLTDDSAAYAIASVIAAIAFLAFGRVVRYVLADE